MKKLILGIKILATLCLFFMRFYFGHIGGGAGLFDGLITVAIWVDYVK